MKYLHIMLANGSSTYKFIRGLFNSLPMEEFLQHEFIISETLNFVVKNAPNLLVYNYDNINYLPIKGKKTAKLRLQLMQEKMEQAELIIWHSLIPMNTAKKAKLANKYCHKSAWVTLMGDRLKPDINSRKREVKKLAREKLKFMKDVKYVNCSVPWFMKSFSKDYGDFKSVSEIPYPIDSRHLEIMKNCPPSQSDKLKIIVGYDGGTINKHEKLFTYLNLQPDDDFSIILPMNFAMFGEWGKTERWQYRDRVLQNGVNRFGAGKVVKLRRKNVAPEEYFRMYGSCDIGVFYDNRPFGMSVLFYMLYMGKKVFIKGSSVLVARLRSLYLPVYSLAEMKLMTAQELKAPVCDEDFLDMYRIERQYGQPLTALVEEESLNKIYKWNKPQPETSEEEPLSSEADNTDALSEKENEPSEQDGSSDGQDSGENEAIESNEATFEEEYVHSDEDAADDTPKLAEEQYEIYIKPMTPEEQADIRHRRALGRKWLESYMSVSNTMERWLAWLESIRRGCDREDKFDMNVMEGLEYDEQTSG